MHIGRLLAASTVLATAALLPVATASTSVAAGPPGSVTPVAAAVPLPPSGAVTGTVRGPDGRAAAGVVVTVTSAGVTGHRTWSAVSGRDGRYSVRGVPGPGIAGEWCAETGRQAAALASRCATTPLRSFGSDGRVVHDVWLHSGQVVRGSVRGSDGRPIAGAAVWLLRAAGSGPAVLARVTTDATGAYRTRSDVSVRVCAMAPDRGRAAARQGWATTCGQGITPGGPAEDLVLSAGGAVAGRVSDPDGRPVAGVRVSPTDDLTGGTVPEAWTGPDGRYFLRGLAAWQGVLAVDAGRVRGAHGTGFVWQVHTDPATGRQVEVALVPGAVVDGVDDVLVRGAAVTGRVTGPAGAATGATVDAGRTLYASEPARSSWSGRGGGYAVVGIRPGVGSVCVKATSMPVTAANLRDECWQNRSTTEYTPVEFVSGRLVSRIDPRLDAAGAAAILLRDSSGTRLGGAEVSVSDGSNQTVTTDVNGRATMRNLAPGQTSVSLRAETVTPEMSPTGVFDSASTTMDVRAGRTVPVTVTATRAAAVTGKVLDASGAPLAQVGVGLFTDAARTGTDGVFRLRGLSSYQGPTTVVCFFASAARGPSPTGYIDECHRDAAGPDAATPVPIANGTTTRLPNTVLQRAGSMSGRLALPDGSAAAYVGVSVTTREGAEVGNGGYHSTGPDGTWRVDGLRPGEYVVCFSPNDTYGRECWDDADDLAGATAVTVRSGQVRSGVDAVLDPLASISGRVLDPDGRPVADAEVSVGGGGDRMTTTDTDGAWSVPGLARGSYRVCVRPHGELAGECWRDAQPGEEGTPVAVRTSPVTGIDLTPPVGGRLEGTITRPGGGPIDAPSWVTVVSVDTGERFGSAVALDGHYRVPGLAPGGYRVCAVADGGWLQTCRGQVTEEWQSDPVVVALGEVVDMDLEMIPAATVSGTVTLPDGSPADGTTVVLTGTNRYEYATTASDGSYSATQVAPGGYTVCAFGSFGVAQTTCYGAPDGGEAPTTAFPGGETRGIDIRLRAP